jgi:hypothetical protein
MYMIYVIVKDLIGLIVAQFELDQRMTGPHHAHLLEQERTPVRLLNSQDNGE